MNRENTMKYLISVGGGVTLILAVTVLCYLFPYTGDDWTWGSEIGIERLQNHFRDYNGRYFGNLIVLVLTRSRVIRTLMMSSCILGIAALLIKLSDCSGRLVFLVIALIFSAPKALLRQSIVWTSGFSNYAVSIAFFLLCTVWIKYSLREETEEKSSRKVLYAFLTLVFGYLGAMIIEHITVMQVLLSSVAAFLTWRKQKRPNAVCCAWFIGSALGALTMFSNGNYAMIAGGQDSLRTVASGGKEVLFRCWSNYFDVIAKQMILDNVILELLLAGVVTCLVMGQHDWLKRDRKQTVVRVSLMIVDLAVFYGTITRLNPMWDRVLGRGKCLDGCVNAALWCALLVLTCYAITEKVRRNRMIYLLSGIAFANASLLLVTPIGPRCFFATYIMTIWYCLECLAMLRADEGVKRYLLQIAAMITVFVFFMNFEIYGHVYAEDKERLNMIRQACEDEKSAVTVPGLSYEDYVHYSDLHDVWSERYKMFYGIPMGIEIKTGD